MNEPHGMAAVMDRCATCETAVERKGHYCIGAIRRGAHEYPYIELFVQCLGGITRQCRGGRPLGEVAIKFGPVWALSPDLTLQ